MIYRKKISRLEAENGYIVIERNEVDRFPPLGAKFALRFGELSFRARVTANPSNYNGAWHDDYHIEARDLKHVVAVAEGRDIVIAANEGAFELRFG